MPKTVLSKNYYLTLIATALFTSTYYLLLPVLPLHMQAMGGTNFNIGLIMGLFSASSLVLRMTMGKACDRIGPVKIMQWTVYAFFLTPLFYLGDSLLLLGADQLLYGFTIGSFTVSSATLVTISVEKEQMAQAIGIQSIALIAAKGFAPTIGSFIYAHFGLIPVLALTCLLALATLGVTSRLEELPPAAPDSGISFLKVISYRMVWVPSIILITTTFTFGNIMTMLPLLAVERGIDGYGWFFTINTLAVICTRLITGRQEKLSLERLIIFSLVIIFIAVAILALAYSFQVLAFSAIIYGLGYGAVYPALSAIVVNNASAGSRGAALGFFTAAFDIGVSLGSVWGGMSEFLNFTFVYFLASLVPLLGVLCCAFLMKREKIEAET